jgi:hypothetical protein
LMQNSKQIIWKCGTFQIFRNDSNKLKLDSWGNKEDTEFC